MRPERTSCTPPRETCAETSVQLGLGAKEQLGVLVHDSPLLGISPCPPPDGGVSSGHLPASADVIDR